MGDIIKLFLEIVNKILGILENANIFKTQKYLYIAEEDLRIDCVSFLQQIAKINRDIELHKILIDYRINCNDCWADKRLEGKCYAKQYSTYEFSIASTVIKKYDDVYCVGYDLNYSPDKEIRPILISPDGFSKRLSMQLNRSLHKGENFSIRLRYITYGVMTGEKRYLVSSFNYKKVALDEYSITFTFDENIPKEIRVYKMNKVNNSYCFLYKIFPQKENFFIDRCDVSDVNNHEQRIYVF